MPKARLGVALLVPGALGGEVNGLRRALGDGALGRIPPHITLVPPVNVGEDRLPAALALLRSTEVGPASPVVSSPAAGGAGDPMSGRRPFRRHQAPDSGPSHRMKWAPPQCWRRSAVGALHGRGRRPIGPP